MIPVADSSPLSHPLLLPLRSVHTIATDRILIAAPHPDDETLGCGGAIALLRALGLAVHVLVMSDGTRSHPHSRKYPASRLRALREAETREALSILQVSQSDITFLRLPDGSLPNPESPEAKAAIAQCAACLQMVKPEIVLLPWRFDPHPDHRATWQLINAALNQLNNSSRMIEYPIWDWDPEQRGDFTESQQVVAWRLNISNVLEIKLRAIAAYRSQTTDLIDDDPEGFRLTAEMLENFARPWEIYLEEVR